MKELQLGFDTDLTGTFHLEDLILQTARGLATEVGLVPVSENTGAILALLAGASPARSVIEIGTGTGVSGLWLLRGMRSDGVLTTIDIEGEYQRMARRLFMEAGFPSGRTRIITGRALEVLPRLSDAVYDLVFIDGDPVEAESYVEAAARLLRPGGMVILRGMTAAASIRDSGLWSPAVINGLVAAIRL